MPRDGLPAPTFLCWRIARMRPGMSKRRLIIGCGYLGLHVADLWLQQDGELSATMKFNGTEWEIKVEEKKGLASK